MACGRWHTAGGCILLFLPVLSRRLEVVFQSSSASSVAVLPFSLPNSSLLLKGSTLVFSMSTSIPSPTHPPETNLGIVTSWLPLTTTYPSQSGCSSDIYARWGITSGYNAVAFDPEYGISVNTSVSCLPAQATTWWDQLGLQDTTSTVISLGPVICPAQYTTIGTSLVGVGSTLVVCCPL